MSMKKGRQGCEYLGGLIQRVAPERLAEEHGRSLEMLVSGWWQ
jgi:hypothetical protein